MVKIGFLCEGKTEVKVVQSRKFKNYLQRIGIEIVEPVIDAKGGGNLLPDNSREHLEKLWSNGAQQIVVLTDLDEDTCITSTRKRVNPNDDKIVIVAVRKIESWFLADSKTMSLLLKEKFEFELPEREIEPFETLKTLFIKKYDRGIGVKDTFTARVLKYGFSLENAAQHPNCPSAKYFLNKLQQLAKQ